MSFVTGVKLTGSGARRPINTPTVGNFAARVNSFPVIIHDEFVDADSTFLVNHSISPKNGPGATWDYTASSNNLRIVNNRVRSFGSNLKPNVDYGSQDMIGSLIFQKSTAGNTSSLSYMMRYLDDNNNWEMQASLDNQKLFIVENSGGVRVARASSGAVAINAQTDYTINVTARGNDLTVDLDGSNQITFNSTVHNSEEKHGIIFPLLNFDVDDFMVAP